MVFKIGNQDGIFLVFFEEGDGVQPYWYGSVVEYSRTFEQLYDGLEVATMRRRLTLLCESHQHELKNYSGPTQG